MTPFRLIVVVEFAAAAVVLITTPFRSSVVVAFAAVGVFV
jgi:hypothetical protein